MTSDTTSNNYVLHAGDKIGDNIVITAIAEGGMARVYKVKNEALEVFRVVKLLKPNSEIDADRFVTEARISANLNHPNIIQCYRFAKYKDTVPYIEMEFVDGANLYHLISKNGILPVPVVISIVYYICKALYALHTCSYTLYNVERSGIVHRDIKPANIIISREGNVKLADFGIAKPRDLTIHTSAIQVVGSIFYLSPEQLKKEDLDFRSDIYSLGCVIYEMVTAKKAFEQNNISDIVVAKLDNDYDTDRLKDCPDKLKNIIAKCLNPLKEERFGKTEEVSEEIDSLLEDYDIQDPQKIINNYIQRPNTFLRTSLGAHEKETRSRITALVPILVIVTIITLFGIIFFIKKESDQVEYVSKAPTVKKKPDSSASKVSAVIPSKPAHTKKKKKISKKPVVSPPVKQLKKEEKVSDKKSLDMAFAAFRRRHFAKCISLLADNNNLNDTLFLCYLGSLAETKNFLQLSNHLNTRFVHDGYHLFLKGRVAYNNKDFDSATKHFLKALTVRSFHPKLSYYSNYYLAKSNTAKYLKTPNIVNKNVMLKSLERFKTHFCNNRHSSECSDINALLKKHK